MNQKTYFSKRLKTKIRSTSESFSKILKTKIRSTREHRSKKRNLTQYLKTGTNKGMGPETHTQTNRARRHRQEVNLTQ